MKDNDGNKWDIFGYAVEGPLKGERLISPSAYNLLVGIWKDFYSIIELFED